MTDTDITLADGALHLRLPGGTRATCPAIWLRHNCPSAFHPQTGERLLELLDMPERPGIAAARVEGATLRVDWADGHASRYDLGWLAARAPGRAAPDPADIPRRPWAAGLGAAGVPRHAAGPLLSDDAALRAWMVDTKATGLSIVEGLADDPEAGMDVARRIAHLRETNFGTTFEVVSRPDPNNLAYTAVALPLHTDLPNQEMPPGYQVLHCLANGAEGGGSVFADGVALAEDLRAAEPEAFRLLAGTAVPFRFFDAGTDIRGRFPVIETDGAGRVTEMRHNQHILDVIDLPADEAAAWYAAWRKLLLRIADPAFHVTLRLAPGEMVVFDNRRVLHGREAFDPATGRRHLRGTYVDRGDFDSRLRVLARADAASAAA